MIYRRQKNNLNSKLNTSEIDLTDEPEEVKMNRKRVVLSKTVKLEDLIN